MKVRPVDGFKVYDPDRRDYLPVEGRDVPDEHIYWHRRLRDGDVFLAPGAPALPAEAPAEEPAPAPVLDAPEAVDAPAPRSSKASRDAAPADAS